MSIFVTKRFYFLLIVSAYFTCFLITPSYSQCPFARNWSVYIYSAMPDPVDVNVKSGDDDLGHHNITFDLGYRFNFCESIFGNTLFVGYFSHKFGSAHMHVFDRKVGALIGCKFGGHANVYWLLKQDGYYLSKEYKPYNDPTWELRGRWE
ncbi:hypothetical protein QVD17_33972 [Tagetes erecta]|uniref:S-protein homolog n=1 Tax=Tagetes erecta TaxID=13708 RepID=A0AAD8NK47_TARER|nr:hypothetical protein QVD17_33972 [Tagetes erecta]